MGLRRQRATFRITPRQTPSPGYDAACLVEACGWRSLAWDYRRNALRMGYNHAATHEEVAP